MVLETSKIFFKKCPTRRCEAIGGFYLPPTDIEEDGDYYCEVCQKETKLSIWRESNEQRFKMWLARIDEDKREARK